MYTDAQIFEYELERIWEKTWIFIGHESQIPNAHDFITTQIGRRPVVLTRNQHGDVKAFINACSHRGAQIYRTVAGNSRAMSCPYHGWVFSSNGDLLAVTDEAGGAYPESFRKSELGLNLVPRLESYRGFWFGCLEQEVISLKEHLGDAAIYMDLLLDQSESGWEIIKGSSDYTYEGNWKLQMENGVDSYHAPFVHANFSATIANRKRAKGQSGAIKAMNVTHDREAMKGGYFDFGRGHVTIWRDWDNPQDRFNFTMLPKLQSRLGHVRAHWAIGRLKNLLIFPNLMLMDQMSTQVRVIHPIAVDRTRVTGYAFAPTDEPPEMRRQRLRFYEDFFNASGMATPDDLDVFNLSQRAFQGVSPGWSDLSRGALHKVAGANEHAEELGLRPRASGGWIEDEGLYVGIYEAWMDYILKGNSDV
ncbi:MAG: aromatic ring-hydroxylating dioxygenase subunit alpha [Pigmentiphaga sp.]|nr:aromatic ring-hydroxylating dioxygenase subunit alpha [Pigmentiphaga sp.]